MRFCSLKTVRSSLCQGIAFQSIIVWFIRALAIYTATHPYSVHFIVPTSAYLRCYPERWLFRQSLRSVVCGWHLLNLLRVENHSRLSLRRPGSFLTTVFESVG